MESRQLAGEQYDIYAGGNTRYRSGTGGIPSDQQQWTFGFASVLLWGGS
jgi:hypothetical protein